MGHGVLHDFIVKLRNSPNELEVLGDGNQEKPYFLVEDCIEGMLHALTHSKKQYDIFNLGTDTTTIVRDIARIVIEEVGAKQATIRYTGGTRGWPRDVPLLQYDISKIRALGWQPRHTPRRKPCRSRCEGS